MIDKKRNKITKQTIIPWFYLFPYVLSGNKIHLSLCYAALYVDRLLWKIVYIHYGVHFSYLTPGCTSFQFIIYVVCPCRDNIHILWLLQDNWNFVFNEHLFQPMENILNVFMHVLTKRISRQNIPIFFCYKSSFLQLCFFNIISCTDFKFSRASYRVDKVNVSIRFFEWNE